MKNKGFTLAEVLITLGIIGVVAALTLPTVITNYKKKETVTKLKKGYTTINNALNYARAQYGDPELWEINSQKDIQTSSEFTAKYLIPYMNVIKSCNNSISGDCAYNARSLKNTPLDWSNYTRFILNDGTLILVSALQNPPTHTFPKLIYVHIDINGLKKPNKKGIDLFDYAVVLETTENMYKPTGRLNASGQSQPLEVIKENCSKNNSGSYCSALIIHNNWEIPDDYPW